MSLFVTIGLLVIIFHSRFQSTACKGCHDILMINTDINSIIILNILDLDYRYIIFVITKQEAINLSRIADLIENIGSL